MPRSRFALGFGRVNLIKKVKIDGESGRKSKGTFDEPYFQKMNRKEMPISEKPPKERLLPKRRSASTRGSI